MIKYFNVLIKNYFMNFFFWYKIICLLFLEVKERKLRVFVILFDYVIFLLIKGG